MDTLGEKVRKVRGTISRAEFAKKYGIHPNTLERYETGKRKIPRTFLMAVSKGENVEIFGLNLGKELPNGEDEIKTGTMCQFSAQEKTQSIEISGQAHSQNWHENQVLKLQQEIIDLLKEKNALVTQNSELRLENEKLRLRIKELEKEIERLRGELSLAKSRAAGVQAS